MTRPIAIDELLRRIVEQPYYLADDERLEVRSSASEMLEEAADEVQIWGAIIKKDSYDVVREAGVTIDGRHFRRAAMVKGTLIDLVVSKVEELYEALEPEPLPDDLMQLAMLAFGDEPACDVLCDALLERGAIRPPRRTIGRRTDTRTDAEKADDERADLRKKTKAWARPFIEILFRRNWSTKPWAMPVTYFEAEMRIQVTASDGIPRDSFVIYGPDNYASVRVAKRTG